MKMYEIICDDCHSHQEVEGDKALQATLKGHTDHEVTYNLFASDNSQAEG